MGISFRPDQSKSHLLPKLVCDRSDHFGHADALPSSRGLPSHPFHRLRNPRRCNPKDMLMNLSCRSLYGCVKPYLTQRVGVYIVCEHVGVSLSVSQSRSYAPTCSSHLTDVRLANCFCKLEHVKQTQYWWSLVDFWPRDNKQYRSIGQATTNSMGVRWRQQRRGTVRHDMV